MPKKEVKQKSKQGIQKKEDQNNSDNEEYQKIEDNDDTQNVDDNQDDQNDQNNGDDQTDQDNGDDQTVQTEQTDETDQTNETDQTENNNDNNDNDNNGDIDEDNMSVTPETLNVKNLYFGAQEINKEATQNLCFPKYIYDDAIEKTPDNFKKHGKQLLLVTQPIKMVRGCIPKFNQKYNAHPNHSSRGHFYIPLNNDDPNSVELFNAIKRLDNYMANEINKLKNNNKILCYLKNKERTQFKDLTYSRMITTAKGPSEEDREEGAKEFIPYDRINVKFATKYDKELGPNDDREITTQVFIGDNENPEHTPKITDIEKYFKWQCTAQFALVFNKAWIQKAADKKCGIGIKCVQIGITELAENRPSTSLQIHGSLFSNNRRNNPNGNTNSNQSNNKHKSNQNQGKDKNTDENTDENTDDNNVNNDDNNDNDNNDNNDNNDQNGDESEPESDDENSKKNVLIKGKQEQNKQNKQNNQNNKNNQNKTVTKGNTNNKNTKKNN